MHTNLHVVATEDGQAASGQAVVWVGGAGLALTGGDGVMDTQGRAAEEAILGPLAAGSGAQASACVWTEVCGISRH